MPEKTPVKRRELPKVNASTEPGLGQWIQGAWMGRREGDGAGGARVRTQGSHQTPGRSRPQQAGLEEPHPLSQPHHQAHQHVASIRCPARLGWAPWGIPYSVFRGVGSTMNGPATAGNRPGQSAGRGMVGIDLLVWHRGVWTKLLLLQKPWFPSYPPHTAQSQ